VDITQTQNGSMTGKRVVITGPTSGFGREMAAQLAALGAELVLACRDLGRGERTVDEIARRTGAKNCVVMPIDTSSQQSIHEFARQYRARYPRLDVLINNAGINRSQRQTSVDGIELTFATNVLGYYLLARDLLDLLRASAPARIVNMASSFASDLDLTDLQFERRAYDGRKAYAQSKACDRMLTWAFARRLAGSGVTANALAPGLAGQTGLYRDTSPAVRLLMRLMSLVYGRSVAQGADTAIWLASSSKVHGVNGRFFDRRQEVLCKYRNVEAEEQLWSICEGLTGSTQAGSRLTPGSADVAPLRG
jgi:NAD(P)-dependent dehydrogenase (short-subunit alcohol dehydrogenase family)